jgi:hypothetical protein
MLEAEKLKRSVGGSDGSKQAKEELKTVGYSVLDDFSKNRNTRLTVFCMQM